MRHRCHTLKIGRTTSHRRSMVANMLKSLIMKGRIETTLVKAKHLRSHADRMITLAKAEAEDSLTARRRAIAKLQVRFNALTPKEARAVKTKNDTSSYNDDRLVINKLFTELGPRYKERQGGYTRIVRTGIRVGDNAERCLVEFVV